jgi:hypothetical protein
MYARNEIVRAGNNTAKVKYYDQANNVIVLYDIQGTFSSGMVITGDDSNHSLLLDTFTLDSEANNYYYDLYFDDYPVFYVYVVTDDGDYVVLDDAQQTRVTL